MRPLVLVVSMMAVAVMVAGVAGCGPTRHKSGTPGLAARGTTMTTAKPTRQDLANKVSLAGKVTLNPVFGLVAPVGGEVRYFDVTPPRTTPTKPTRVATVWAGGKPTYVEVPAGSILAGRLVDDRSTVAAGTPIISAKYVGYGVVAEIDGAQAYKIADGLAAVQGQIKSGPGPFACTVLGTIAALPAGTLPQSAPSSPPPRGGGGGSAGPGVPGDPGGAGNGEEPGGTSEPTGLRLVCTAPADVKMINGVSVTLEVVTAKASGVLVLPVEAVAGAQGRGKVDVVRPDGTRETRDVVLGLTDGKVIEIKSGLTGDETVAVPGPNLPAARPADGGTDGPTGMK